VSPDRTQHPAAVVVLAAGEGTRMRSDTPKVLHTVGGRTLVGHAVAAAGALAAEHVVVVVGHGRDAVTAHLADVAPGVRTAVQDRQLGTGHAVACALETLPELAGTVVVTYGDVPLLTGETLRALVADHAAEGNAVTVLTAQLRDPTGYGRVVRDPGGAVTAIVEEKDATPAERALTEVNSGIYAFDAAVLRDGLSRLKTDNAQGELYLTDVVSIARSDGNRVGALTLDDSWQTEGVNDRVQLASLHRELNRRTVERWMRAGVTVIDPATTWIDADVQLEPDAVLEPNVLLRGATTVGRSAAVGPNCLLVDTSVGAGASVVNTTAYGAEIGPEATVGPYTYLRPGTRLGTGAKAGGFVEMKAAVVGDGAKVPHLSYVGDAEIGAGANIGAGTIFANYDGVAKHRTEVGEHVFVGSDSVLVAPVRLADGSYVAAGSTVTKAVGPGELAVARGQQRNVAGWVARRRAGSASARAAARADGAAQEQVVAPEHGAAQEQDPVHQRDEQQQSVEEGQRP
jgi:bifunctional UDP-N-acetylglucosamine pyrophosphorylase/glucosamine-1-phosphate N-acetyltransferase